MISGKGMFVHKLKSIEDPEEAASKAFDASLTHVLIKVLDGVWRYNQRAYYEGGTLKYSDDLLRPYIKAFHDKGIEVHGWQWVYHTTWSPAITEARMAKERVIELGLDGFGIDAEASVKNKSSDSVRYANELEGISVPVFLSTYRYPSLHREINYKAYLSVCDFVSPQVYWASATNAGAQLMRSIGEWRGMTDLPIIPTGAAYSEHGWTAKAGEVVEFLQTAVDNELPGANFWVWHHATKLGLWDYIAQFPWPGEEPVAHSVFPNSAGVKLNLLQPDGVSIKYHGHIDKV
jgi:hypothetical protein